MGGSTVHNFILLRYNQSLSAVTILMVKKPFTINDKNIMVQGRKMTNYGPDEILEGVFLSL